MKNLKGTETREATGSEVKRAVRGRYARAAVESSSCCEPACCAGGKPTTTEDVSRSVGYGEEDLAGVPEEANLGLGCGNPTAIASLRPGEVVLDLGSGAGIDCFLAAKQVGPSGRVIGVDMTPEMIDRARANAEQGGFRNVEFRLGEIEALPVADESVDAVISNCVLNLSPEKERVLGEVFRVLKPGGRLVISDLVSDVPVPAVLGGDLDAVAGCLPTFRARYLELFRCAGFGDARIASERTYPGSYFLSEPSVLRYLADHPEATDELTAFAGSIAGAHFEATRP